MICWELPILIRRDLSDTEVTNIFWIWNWLLFQSSVRGFWAILRKGVARRIKQIRGQVNDFKKSSAYNTEMNVSMIFSLSLNQIDANPIKVQLIDSWNFSTQLSWTYWHSSFIYHSCAIDHLEKLEQRHYLEERQPTSIHSGRNLHFMRKTLLEMSKTFVWHRVKD